MKIDFKIPLICMALLLPTMAAAKAEDQALSKASYSFPVEELKLEGSNIHFIIPSKAKSHDDKADAVLLSGLYADDQDHADSCPVVDSHDVDKKVKSYNPFIGRAEVVATFDNPEDAKRAAKAACLLIYDKD